MLKKPNLLVLGASGGVANAFLHHLTNCRNLFNKLILLDKNKKVLSDSYINHKLLDYLFIHKKIELPQKEEEYLNLLKKYKIDLVLDITDMESLNIIDSTNRAGISYVNTAMNSDNKTVSELIFEIYPKKEILNRAPHILCAGMNPGAVNAWVRYGIEKFGVPANIIHFEYDTSKTIKKWHPTITWSIHEFLVENVRDPSGVSLGRCNVKKLYPNALERRENMRDILKPIMPLKDYPTGFTVLHEENLTVSYKYNIPSKFIYAINQQTMRNLINLYEKTKKVSKRHLKLCDNRNEILEGSDSIGVMLEYPDKKVYFFNTMPNNTAIGTSGTYTQVTIGIFAALFALMFDKIKPGINFVEDLYGTYLYSFLFDNMRIQEFVFKKKGKNLILEHYDPMVKIKRNKHFDHLYII